MCWRGAPKRCSTDWKRKDGSLCLSSDQSPLALANSSGNNSSTVLPLVFPTLPQHCVLSPVLCVMHRICRGLNLLLELRPPLGFCLVHQREALSLPGERAASSHPQLLLGDQGRGAAGECVCTEAAGFEGAGLQCTPRLVFQSGWKCCLVFASFLSSLSDPKKQLKLLETANLKGEKKPATLKLKIKGT